jgi:prepilin-type N-terminal cleavage/methylation domain-containing protein
MKNEAFPQKLAGYPKTRSLTDSLSLGPRGKPRGIGEGNKRGVTLLEIIVSLVILSLVMLGIVNIVIVAKQYLTHTRLKLVSSQLGKQAIDDSSINFTDVDSAATNFMLDNTNYGVKYTMSDVTNTGNAVSGPVRKVIVNITWNETNFQ